MYVIAFDPGLTTGVAEWRIGDWEKPEAWQVNGRKNLYDQTKRGLLMADVVICESFNPRGGALTQQLDPLYIIGHLEGMCYENDIPFVLQSPAEAKSWSTDGKLKAVDWWVPGQDHARDALRHLLRWCCLSAGSPVQQELLLKIRDEMLR